MIKLSVIWLAKDNLIIALVRFYQLLLDYGKESIDSLDQRDRQLCEMQRKAQAELIR